MIVNLNFKAFFLILLVSLTFVGCDKKNENIDNSKIVESEKISAAFEDADYSEELIPNDIFSQELIVFDRENKNSVVIKLYSRYQEKIDEYLATTELTLNVNSDRIKYDNSEFSNNTLDNVDTHSHNEEDLEDDNYMYDYLVIKIDKLNFEEDITQYDLEVKNLKVKDNTLPTRANNVNCLDYFEDGTNSYWWDDNCLNTHFYKLNKWWHHGQICLDPTDPNPLGFWWHRKNKPLSSWKLAHKGMFNYSTLTNTLYHQHEYAGGFSSTHAMSSWEIGTSQNKGTCYDIYNSGYRLMLHTFYMDDLETKMTINQKKWSSNNWSNIYWWESQ